MKTTCSVCGFDGLCPHCDGHRFTAGYLPKSTDRAYRPRDFRYEETECIFCYGTGLEGHSCAAELSRRSLDSFLGSNGV